MPDTLAVVTLRQGSLLPVDDIKYGFAFSGTPAGNFDELFDVLVNFFNGDDGGLHTPVARYISWLVSRAVDGSLIQFYDITGHLDGSDKGSPFFEAPFTLGLAEPGPSALPSSVAMACTFIGEGRNLAPVEGPGTRPKQRRTGRIYLGPLLETTIEVRANGVRFNLGVLDNINLAFDRLLFNSAAQAFSQWKVWSRKDAALRDVVGGFIDDRIDTIQSRDLEAAARRTWGFTG